MSEPERPGVFDHEIAPVEPPPATEAVQEPGAGEPDPPPQSDETPPPGPETPGSAAPESPPAPPVTPPAAQDIPAHVTGGLQVPAGRALLDGLCRNADGGGVRGNRAGHHGASADDAPRSHIDALDDAGARSEIGALADAHVP